jgi:hypothetical protein
MQRKDWLGLVAVHSDAWLMALAFYKGARLDAEERWVLWEDQLSFGAPEIPVVFVTWPPTSVMHGTRAPWELRSY